MMQYIASPRFVPSEGEGEKRGLGEIGPPHDNDGERGLLLVRLGKGKKKGHRTF
jgi:hypothetical protein